MKDVRMVLTMDCEPTTATSDASAPGPADWALGKRAVLAAPAVKEAFVSEGTVFETTVTAAPGIGKS
jgi:hypothetical protein